GRSTPPLPREPSRRSLGGNVTAVQVSVMPYAWPIQQSGRTDSSWVVSSELRGAAPLISMRTELRSYFFTAGCLHRRTTIGGTRLRRCGRGLEDATRGSG